MASCYTDGEINTASAIVNCQFDYAYAFAQTLMGPSGKLTEYLDAMTNYNYTPGTLSVSWNSIAPPPTLTIPGIETLGLPDITPDFTEPQPADFSATLVGTTFTTFSETAPVLDALTAPVVTYGSVPTVYTPGAVTLPDDVVVAMPLVPSYLSLSTPTMTAVDLHPEWLDVLDTIPVLNLVSPTPYTYNSGPEYTSALLTSLKNVLLTRMAGGTGLDPAVEQAIWDRARDRETAVSQSNIDEISRQSDALGFQLPAGVLAAQLRQAQQDYYDKASTLSRDIAVKQAELEQENLKQTIAAGMDLEGKLVDYSYKMEQLAFETAKEYADNGIKIYNAEVDQYKALLDGYRTYAAAYDTIIKGELSKVEVYKAELQAEQTKAQVNQSLVDQYKATIDAEMSKVTIYTAQVSAAKVLVDLESTRVSATAEQVKAFIAQVNAETAKVEAFKASVQAQQAEVETYKAQVQAFASQVGAEAEQAKVRLGEYEAKIKVKALEWDGYKAVVGTETARLNALVGETGALVDAYKAEMAGLEAKANNAAKYWEVQVKDYEAGQRYIMEGAKINLDQAATLREQTLGASKVGAQIYSQLMGSAMSTAHVSAGIGYTNSNTNSQQASMISY